MTATTKQRVLRIWPVLVIIGALLVSPSAGDVWTAPSLTVNLASGRQFTGQIDPRSDADLLWLRFGHRSAYVVRPIAWDHVVRAARGGDVVDVEQLREGIRDLEDVAAPTGDAASAPENLPQQAATPDATVTSGAAVCERASETEAPRSRSPVRRPRVVSIRADVWAANWDADVENDGIEVQVVALDANGYSVPVSGSLNVYLIGPRARRFNESPRSHGVSFDRLGRWARRVRPEDLQETGMTYRLAYQATNPQFDTRLGSHAMVNVRLSVPGSGTFERTIDYVRIQPFSPLRDYHQLYTGRRWLDVEQTGRGKRPPYGS